MAAPADATGRTVTAGVLAWLLPGAGHLYLGQRRFALIFGAAIMLPYLTGVAIGGVKTLVNPYLNRWLFLAELGAGGPTTVFLLWNNRIGGLDARTATSIIRQDAAFLRYPPDRRQELRRRLHPYVAYYPTSDVAQIYLAVAGLLNVLAILDAMTRAQTGGLPVFYHELASGRAKQEEPA